MTKPMERHDSTHSWRTHELSLLSLLIAGLAATCGTAFAQRSIQSPDGRNKIGVIATGTDQPEGTLALQIARDGKRWFTVGLGLEVEDRGDLMQGVTVDQQERRTINTSYRQPGNKSNPVLDHGNELTLELARPAGGLHFRVECRAYNDGVAFRYVIPQHPDLTDLAITQEMSSFEITGDPRVWPLYLANYRTSYESDYEQSPASRLKTDELIALPLLLELQHGAAAITEAALSNYAGMYLRARHQDEKTTLVSSLSPLPNDPAVKVRSKPPLATPWRVVMMGDDAGHLLESNLILNLNEPCAIEDTSWLRFGKTTWNWWNGYFQQPVDFKTGANFATLKHYIDHCARNGIAFHAIDCANAELTWFRQTAPGFSPPGADADILTPRPELAFFKALAYAKSKGVGIRLWIHAELLRPRLEEALARYQEWGVEGLMVDFLDRDDQDMVNWSEQVLKLAARHHLRIQFHGIWKPTGRRRTYPNLVNHEAVLNLEYLKWSDRCDPEHNLITPYTRMLAGPMDYHLGGFQSVPRDQFVARNVQPNVMGTRCHHLAMYVVYENPVPMVADGPSAYEGQPGFDFLCAVPTTWDETRFLTGTVGDFIVVARRHGEDWYIGAMTDWTARALRVPLSFLASGTYEVSSWADQIDSVDPNALVTSRCSVTSTDSLFLQMASGGGRVVRLSPKITAPR